MANRREKVGFVIGLIGFMSVILFIQDAQFFGPPLVAIGALVYYWPAIWQWLRSRRQFRSRRRA